VVVFDGQQLGRIGVLRSQEVGRFKMIQRLLAPIHLGEQSAEQELCVEIARSDSRRFLEEGGGLRPTSSRVLEMA